MGNNSFRLPKIMKYQLLHFFTANNLWLLNHQVYLITRLMVRFLSGEIYTIRVCFQSMRFDKNKRVDEAEVRRRRVAEVL